MSINGGCTRKHTHTHTQVRILTHNVRNNIPGNLMLHIVFKCASHKFKTSVTGMTNSTSLVTPLSLYYHHQFPIPMPMTQFFLPFALFLCRSNIPPLHSALIKVQVSITNSGTTKGIPQAPYT